MNVEFTKMHGLGNDFILVDCRDSDLPDLSRAARKLCDRRFGIGADQILLLYPSAVADFRMRIFNADGSEVEMCGNGIRCLAKYLWDRGLSHKNRIEIETLAGIIRPEKVNGRIRVNMGAPIFEPEKIPVSITQERLPIIDFPIEIEGRELRMTCVSMGNPHAVIVVDNVSSFPVAYYGPLIEHHHFFPRRTNVEFIEVLNPSEINMRVWERGSGETFACGTGAAAAAVASRLKGLTEEQVTVHLTGGDLFIEWTDGRDVYMTGTAVEVFTGTIDFDSMVAR